MNKKAKISILVGIIAVVVVAAIIATIVIINNNNDLDYQNESSSKSKTSSRSGITSSVNASSNDDFEKNESNEDEQESTEQEGDESEPEAPQKMKLERYENGIYSEILIASLSFDKMWEPGECNTVYFKLSNVCEEYAGAMINVIFDSETLGTNVSGQSYKLSDCMKIAMIDISEEQVGKLNRDDINSVNEAWFDLKSMGGCFRGLNKGEAVYYALVVKMPTDIGNEFNQKGGTANPTFKINISINVQ